MANALGKLFGDIANAIRSKTGEEGAMKPAQFPSKIAGIEIGGGSSTDVRYVTFMNGNVVLYKKPVAVGDDCVDVYTKDLISTPTKESTVSEVYSYSGWALSDGGNADANALKAVNADRTVYAAYTASVRYYTITYYDGDTVLKTESLTYGATPTYEPDKKSGYSFTGWNPAIVPVTGDASYYAQWENTITFAGGSWADIATIAESGRAADTFSIGDTREEGGLIYQIVGFNHDTLSDGSGTAGLSILCKNTISTYSHGGGANNGGYSQSMQMSTTNKIYSGTHTDIVLASDLVAVIKQVKKYYDYVSNSSDPTEDTLNLYTWLPSLKEITGENPWHIELSDTQYQFFATEGNYIRYLNGEADAYWTRTTNGYNKTSYAWKYITSTGEIGTCNYANIALIFGFCI